MKTRILQVVAVMLWVLFALPACTKTEIVEKEVIKTVTETVTVESGYTIDALNVSIPAEGGTTAVSFSSTESWNASVINGRADGWLSFSPANGSSGSAKIDVKTEPNTSSTDRSATLRISSGKKYTDFNIVQKSANSLLATTTKYEIGQAGGEFSVEMKSDVEFSWSVEPDAEGWLSEKSTTKAVSTKTVTFEASANQGERREGRIIFKSGNLKEVVSVYQEGRQSNVEHIVLSCKDCQISSDGGTLKIELSKQYDVSLRIPDGYDWIREGDNQSTNTFYLQIDPNADVDSREGFVSFTDKNGGFSENVNILQLQRDAIVLAKSRYMFGNEGGTLDLEVLANNQVQVAVDADWVQNLAETKGMTSQTLQFKIDAGRSGEDRTAVITLKSGSVEQKVQVRQFPMNDPIHFDNPEVKARLVLLFDADMDGELSYKEAAEVTTLMNVFNEVETSTEQYSYFDNDGNIQLREYVSYWCWGPYINPYEFTSFKELVYFTGLTEIAPYSFSRFPCLSEIVIPEGVKRIGVGAFSSSTITTSQLEQGMSGLLSVTLPEGLEVIDSGAFSGCPLTKGVVLPESLKTIGSSAFYGCYLASDNYDTTMGRRMAADGLKTIRIPDSVTSIGAQAFNYCMALETIEIQKTAVASDGAFSYCPEVKNLKGSAVSPDGKGLIDENGNMYAFFETGLTEYSFPEGVKTAITICPETIRSLTIPSSFSMKNADGDWYNPFTGYYQLETFHSDCATSDGKSIIKDGVLIAMAPSVSGTYSIPDSVTGIADAAMCNSALENVVMHDRVNWIGRHALANSLSLRECTLPRGSKVIPGHMFYSCRNLDTIRNIENVETIQQYGLYGCDKLLSRFKVPATVKRLEPYSLYASSVCSIIEFASLFPPTMVWDMDSREFPVNLSKSLLYVPDIVWERYQQFYYGFGCPVRKSSELYDPISFDIEDNGDQIILRIEGDDSYGHQYALNKVEAGSFRRHVPSTRHYQYGDYSYDFVNVNITEDFYIGQTEFPQWLWTRIMHFNPSHFNEYYYTDAYDYYPSESEFRPVENITWDDCCSFLAELSRLTGLNFRLPTEAEWEFAARGGKNSCGYNFSGSNNPDEVAVYYAYWTSPVGSRWSNELGLYDMNGNVFEYCQDYYESWSGLAAEDMPQGDDPTGPESGNFRVIRGGCYGDSLRSNGFSGDLSSNRYYSNSYQSSSSTTGFRPVL